MYYVLISTSILKIKSAYEGHALRDHPDNLPEDLQLEPVASTGDIETAADITIITVKYLSVYISIYLPTIRLNLTLSAP